MYVITPKRAEKFIEGLQIERFFGIGKKTAEKMHGMGIFTGLDLKQKSEEFLIDHFGKSGGVYYLNARGIDHRIVNPNRIRKSVGTEHTFSEDTNALDILQQKLEIVTFDLLKRIEKSNFKGKTVTLKIKYSDFQVISKSKTFSFYIDNFELLTQTASELLELIPLDTKIRLVGLSIKNNEPQKSEIPERKSISIQLKLPFQN